MTARTEEFQARFNTVLTAVREARPDAEPDMQYRIARVWEDALFTGVSLEEVLAFLKAGLTRPVFVNGKFDCARRANAA